ncbi:hypothetical protein D3C78_1781840 [compost metagenome]
MALDMGLWLAKLYSSNRASKTGLVIRCCASISMISPSVMLSLRSSRSSAAKALKAARSLVLVSSSRMAWMRSMWVRAILAMSLAQSAQ